MDKKIILEYDDFHPDSEVNCLGVVRELVHDFPNILINMFTVPCYKNQPLFENEEWCKEVRNLIKSNNLRLAIHGTYHTQELVSYPYIFFLLIYLIFYQLLYKCLYQVYLLCQSLCHKIFLY